jgi:hypothetical protein
LALVAVTRNATPTYPAGGETDENPARESLLGSTITSPPGDT